MLKEIFHESFQNFKTYKDLYGNPYKCDWAAKVVFLIQVSVAVAIATFEIYG